MLIQLAQPFWRELLLLEELEHRGAAVMTREVVRRARKPRRPRPIRHASTRRLRQIGEFAEPAGEHRPERRVGGESQERVARAELAVLVAPPHHVGPPPPFL